MLCSISGTVPENPVVCVKTGNIYERKYIEKYLATHDSSEPLTGETITINDLLPIKGANTNTIARPRPVEASSVGGLLKLLSTEWDSLLLEQFELRQSLESTRQELSQALYQHDAACRVIARLIKERDQARAALTTAQTTLAQRGAMLTASVGNSNHHRDHAMDTDSSVATTPTTLSTSSSSIPEDILTNLKDKNKELMKGRKKRSIPSETKDTDSVRKFTLTGVYAPHAPSVPGITALQIHPSPQRSHHILTGGMDKTALIYDISTALSPSSVSNPVTNGTIIGRLGGHTKRVSGVAFHPSREAAITCGYDSTVKIHVPTNPMMGEWGTALSLKVHQREAIGIAVHPIHDYVLSGGREGTWSFIDMNTGNIISLVPHQSSESNGTSSSSSSLSSSSSSTDIQYNCLSLHPDGILLGLGTNTGSTSIYDLRTCQIAATFSGHHGNVNALSFSENGYYLASGGDDGKVNISDLRNLQTVCSFTPSSSASTTVTTVNFDASGYYLATGTNNGIVQIFDTKKSVDNSANNQGIELVTLKKHTNEVTQVGWGSYAGHIVSVSMDRNINVYH